MLCKVLYRIFVWEEGGGSDGSRGVKGVSTDSLDPSFLYLPLGGGGRLGCETRNGRTDGRGMGGTHS